MCSFSNSGISAAFCCRELFEQKGTRNIIGSIANVQYKCASAPVTEHTWNSTALCGFKCRPSVSLEFQLPPCLPEKMVNLPGALVELPLKSPNLLQRNPNPKRQKRGQQAMKPRTARAQLRKRYSNFFFFPLFFGRGNYLYWFYWFYFPFQAKPDLEAAEEGGDSSALPSIDIDGSLPDLTLKNEKGEDIQIANLASDKGVILFLVPKADTRTSKKKQLKSTISWFFFYTAGCTNQACGFRDSYPDFTSLNFDVYCLSADTPTAQSKWQTKVKKKKFFLLKISLKTVFVFFFVERASLSSDFWPEANLDHCFGSRWRWKDEEEPFHFREGR